MPIILLGGGLTLPLYTTKIKTYIVRKTGLSTLKQKSAKCVLNFALHTNHQRILRIIQFQI